MSYLVLIFATLLGIALGVFLARRRKGSLIFEQTERKTKNKEKILEYIQENGKIQNNDVERLVAVSNATAERYLNELEKEGQITQHGTIGKSVFYTPRVD